MSTLELLRAAVRAKLAYWDAESALEKALDSEDEKIADIITMLAAGTMSDGDDIEEYHVVDLLGEIE